MNATRLSHKAMTSHKSCVRFQRNFRMSRTGCVRRVSRRVSDIVSYRNRPSLPGPCCCLNGHCRIRCRSLTNRSLRPGVRPGFRSCLVKNCKGCCCRNRRRATIGCCNRPMSFRSCPGFRDCGLRCHSCSCLSLAGAAGFRFRMMSSHGCAIRCRQTTGFEDYLNSCFVVRKNLLFFPNSLSCFLHGYDSTRSRNHPDYA